MRTTSWFFLAGLPAALAAAMGACEPSAPPPRAATPAGGVSAAGAAPAAAPAAALPDERAGQTSRSRAFVVEERGRVIVQIDSAPGGVTRAPLLRVSDVPAEWAPTPGARFRVGADSFHFAQPSEQRDQVAWQAGATHSLLGVVPARSGSSGAPAPRPPTVLDFYFDSRAGVVAWAPAGRYLVARYTSPSGYTEARVYDAERGVRLQAPWENPLCRPADECRATVVRWTGPTTVAVLAARPGAGDTTVVADVAALPPRTSTR